MKPVRIRNNGVFYFVIQIAKRRKGRSDSFHISALILFYIFRKIRINWFAMPNSTLIIRTLSWMILSVIGNNFWRIPVWSIQITFPPSIGFRAKRSSFHASIPLCFSFVYPFHHFRKLGLPGLFADWLSSKSLRSQHHDFSPSLASPFSDHLWIALADRHLQKISGNKESISWCQKNTQRGNSMLHHQTRICEWQSCPLWAQ